LFVGRDKIGRRLTGWIGQRVHSNFNFGFIQMSAMSTIKLKRRMSAP
jgi:hypothetical protein